MTAIIIFVKNAVSGHVKTRLAATVGAQNALEIYLKLLHYTCNITARSRFTRYVYYSNSIVKDDLWNSPDTIKRLQSGKDLGERMHHAFNEVLAEYQRVLIIGSDCGQLTPEHLAEAADLLQWTDVVVGPAEDGGYYLLGLNQERPGLFTDIAWSTRTVLRSTITKILDMGINFNLMQQLSDVDTEEDWEKLGWSLGQVTQG